MTRTADVLATLAIALAAMLDALPADAQQTYTAVAAPTSQLQLPSPGGTCGKVTNPCRTLQEAYNVTAAGGEIDVLTPGNYGPLTISHAISIQGHGFASIQQPSSADNAVTISAGASDAITLNGLLMDGEGSGSNGISITSVASVQILNCVARHFAYAGIVFASSNSGSNLLVTNTVLSDNGAYGIYVPAVPGLVVLDRVTANNNGFLAPLPVTGAGAYVWAPTMISNSVLSNNLIGFETSGPNAWLAKSVVTGNSVYGIFLHGGTVYSYGDNFISGNTTNVSAGSLTPISTQ